MNWLKKLLCKLFRIGCPNPPPPAPPGPSRDGLLFGYFGVQDGQIADTADHVDLVHIGSWGDWTTPEGRESMMVEMCRWGHEALAAGVHRLMFTLDWCLFTQTNPRKLLPEATAVQRLTTFFNRLASEGLDANAFAWYLIDEPTIPEVNLSAAQLQTAIAEVKATANSQAFAQLSNLPIVAIAGGAGSAQDVVQLFDWVGFDNYGSPIFTNGEYDAFVAKLIPGQKIILVPGGDDPWREDPMPFYDQAQADPRVILIMPFKWFGTEGIGANGMAPAYRAVGQRIKVTTP